MRIYAVTWVVEDSNAGGSTDDDKGNGEHKLPAPSQQNLAASSKLANLEKET